MDDNKEKGLNPDAGSSDGINKDINNDELKKGSSSQVSKQSAASEAPQEPASAEQPENSKTEDIHIAEDSIAAENQPAEAPLSDENAPSAENSAPRRRAPAGDEKIKVSNAKQAGKKPGNGKKKRKFGPVSISLLVLCALVFGFAVFNIVQGIIAEKEIDDLKNNNQREEETYDLNPGPHEEIPSRNSPDDMSDQFIALEDVNLENINYLKISNLENFKELNGDTAGWLYVPGPKEITGIPIDISIVQTTDNVYYLNHSFSKKENINGWVFADYENNMKQLTSNRNAVFYGHARSYNMFGGLKDLNMFPDWYNNANNHFIKITTETEETVWQIFSWYETTVEFDYIKCNFDSDKEYVDFLNTVQAKNKIRKADGSSVFQNFEFDKDSKIITLSTCKGTDKDKRVAVHAKLVKSRVREK